MRRKEKKRMRYGRKGDERLRDREREENPCLSTSGSRADGGDGS